MVKKSRSPRKKKFSFEVSLEHYKWLRRIARLAGIPIDDVVSIILAMEIVRAEESKKNE